MNRVVAFAAPAALITAASERAEAIVRDVTSPHDASCANTNLTRIRNHQQPNGLPPASAGRSQIQRPPRTTKTFSSCAVRSFMAGPDHRRYRRLSASERETSRDVSPAPWSR
jgi:hypothetical protein